MSQNTSGNVMGKNLTSVVEDYLEAIFNLDMDKKVVRVKDIAKRLEVKMPTVTSMLKNLSQRGLVNYEKYEYVELTSKGADIGREIQRRHQLLRKFLTDILLIDYQTADEEACKMEHALSSSTLDSLTDLIAFIKTYPRAGDNWFISFEEYRRQIIRPKKRGKHAEEFAGEFKPEVNCAGDDATS